MNDIIEVGNFDAMVPRILCQYLGYYDKRKLALPIWM